MNDSKHSPFARRRGGRPHGRIEANTDNLNYRGPVWVDIEDVETHRFMVRKGTREKGSYDPPPSILALDPGGTLGWSLLVLEKDVLLHQDMGVLLDSRLAWWHGQLDMRTSENAGLQQICKAIDRCPGAIVVSEGFLLRTQVRGQEPLSPVRQSAVVKHFCWLRGRKYFEQDPSFKSTASDARLRNWRVYTKEGGLQHARDADRHAMIFLRRMLGDSALLRSTQERN